MNYIQCYLEDLNQTLSRLPEDRIRQVVQTLHEARLNNRQVFIMGNGGSASTASHFVCDLGKNTRVKGMPNIRVMGLTDNMALFSALANDEGYENENFKVIPSGRLVANPSELLATEKLDKLFTKLNDMADFVIVDSPPMLVADVLFLAAKVDGVLLVIRPGHIQKKAALIMMEQFERADVRVLGVVLNRIPLTGVDSYGSYSYHYYSTYYSNDEESIEKKATTKLKEYLHFHKKRAQAGIENLRNRKADQ